MFARKIERKFGLRTVFHILARFDLCFSNSFIIHAEETKEITIVKEVWICVILINVKIGELLL